MNRVKLMLELNEVELKAVLDALWSDSQMNPDSDERNIVLSVRDVLQHQFDLNKVPDDGFPCRLCSTRADFRIQLIKHVHEVHKVKLQTAVDLVHEWLRS
jgi:hypothetical protein